MEQTDSSKVETAGVRRLPPNAGKGRPAGSVNKNTKALKDMILGALDKAGGVDYLLAQSEQNPTAFLTLIGKVLPTTLAGDKDNPVVIVDKFKLAPLE